MKRVRVWLPVAIGICLIAAAYFVPIDPARVQIVAAIATAVATVIALFSASNSERAAASSERAAQDAVRALSYASKPKIQLRLEAKEGKIFAAAENIAPHSVRQLRLEARFGERVVTGDVDGGIAPLNLTSDGLSFGLRGPIGRVRIGTVEEVAFPVTVRAWFTSATGPTTWSSSSVFSADLGPRDGWGMELYDGAVVTADEEVPTPFRS